MRLTRTVRWGWDLAFALVLAFAFGWALYEAWRFPEGARIFPLAIALPALALALLQAAISLRARGKAPEAPVETDEELGDAERARRTAEVGGWILGMFAAVFLLGFMVAVPLAALAYLRVAARERWVPSVGVAALCWALVFGVFDRALHVPLPPGPLLRLFGVT